MFYGAFLYGGSLVRLRNGRVIATTKEGPVYILNTEKLAVERTIESAFAGEGVPIGFPRSVRCFSQGFLIGGSKGGLSLWEKVDSDNAGHSEFNVLVTTFGGRRSPIATIDINATEQSILLGFENGDIGTCSVTMLFLQNDEMKKGVFEVTFVANGFHSGPVSGLAVAMQRPIAVTCCSTDCSVRVWNYASKTCDLAKVFLGDEPVSVTLSPFGYLVSIGFTEKLRLFHILSGQLLPFREFGMRSVRAQAFSHGGHLLAAATGKMVVVIAVASLKKVATLRAHSGTVTSLAWSNSDDVLSTCGSEGCIYEWWTNSWSRMRDTVLRNAELQCLSYDSSQRLVVHGKDESKGSFLLQISEDGKRQQVQVKHGLFPSILHPQCNNTVMFAGTTHGSVWICPQPIEAGPHAEFGLHSAACRHLCLTADSKTLISAGDDGSVFVTSVQGMSSSDLFDRDAEAMDLKMADVMMLKRNEVQVQQETIENLQREVYSLQKDLKENIDVLHREYQQKMFEVGSKQRVEIEELQRRYEALRDASASKEKEALRVIKHMEATHVTTADQLETLYEKKIAYEADRYVQLQLESQQTQAEQSVVLARFTADYETKLKDLSTTMEARLSEKELENAKLKDMIAFLQQRTQTMIDQEQGEHEADMDKLKEAQNREMHSQKKLANHLRREQDALLRGLDLMEKDKEKVATEQREADQTIWELRSRVDELTRAVECLKREKKERETTMQEKERKIADYKTKVSTLKKFKHVLDFRLREVSESLQPKDLQIQQLKAQLVEVEGEFEKQLAEQTDLEHELEARSQRIAALSSDLKKQQLAGADKAALIRKFTDDLYNLVDKVETRRWPEAIRALYHEYVAQERSRFTQEDLDSMAELERQMRLMEKKVTALSMRSERQDTNCKTDIQKKSEENSLLIVELNGLRKENKSLKTGVRLLEGKVRSLETAQKRALARPPREETVSLPAADQKRVFSARSRPGSGARGGSPGLHKGLPSVSRMTPEDKNKLANLQVKAEMNAQTVGY